MQALFALDAILHSQHLMLPDRLRTSAPAGDTWDLSRHLGPRPHYAPCAKVYIK